MFFSLFRHYDIIVCPLGKSSTIPDLLKDTSQITNGDIEKKRFRMYVAGRLTTWVATFTVGGGVTSNKRKRRDLTGELTRR